MHIGTNDALNNTSTEILDKILKLKTYIQKGLLKCQITISTPIKRHNHGKASLTTSHLNKKFKDFSISIAENSNIGAFYFYLGRLAINLKLKIRKLWYKLELMNDEHDKEMLDKKQQFSGSKESNF